MQHVTAIHAYEPHTYVIDAEPAHLGMSSTAPESKALSCGAGLVVLITCSFEDLASRFERPDARNRWDAPLFTLRPAGTYNWCSGVVYPERTAGTS
jgi:hypothetical protein